MQMHGARSRVVHHGIGEAVVSGLAMTSSRGAVCPRCMALDALEG